MSLGGLVTQKNCSLIVIFLDRLVNGGEATLLIQQTIDLASQHYLVKWLDYVTFWLRFDCTQNYFAAGFGGNHDKNAIMTDQLEMAYLFQ